MKFLFGNIGYHEISEDEVVVCDIKSEFSHVEIPFDVFSSTGKIYRVIGFDQEENWRWNIFDLKSVSFNEESLIERVPSSIINLCINNFKLPPKIKRIDVGSGIRSSIISNMSNQFLSVNKKGDVVHFHPLEISKMLFLKSRLHIKETVRFVGLFSDNNLIKSVSFPPSVEVIGKYAFNDCKCLKYISFRGKSSLRAIKRSAFSRTKIEKIVFPSSLVKIGNTVFSHCKNLRKVEFEEDSRLEIIKYGAFMYSGLQRIDFPRKLKVFGPESFNNCESLTEATLWVSSGEIKISGLTIELIKIAKIDISATLYEENEISIFKRVLVKQ